MEAVRVSRRIWETLVEMAGVPGPRVRAWDGTEWGPDDADATVVLNHPGALRALLLPPGDLAAGEAYVFDDVDFEGNIFSIVEFGEHLAEATRVRYALRLLRLIRRLPTDTRKAQAERPRIRGRRHSLRRDRQAVSHHYDTGNDFFALFLDPGLVYSCAYFLDPTEPLEVAQRRKLDLICRKLELAPGERLLDVGCGWGSLVIHAAANYGVEATGITLSAEQAHLAERRAKEAGVEDRVTILQRDYRELDGTFDAVASVGMFEHVGRDQLGRYFDRLRGLLSPQGRLLNHGIVTRSRKRGRIRPTFVNTYVFPDGELVPVDEAIARAEDAGFELRDAEALRMNYALTLRHWVANLERHHEQAQQTASEEIYRIWRLYMAGSAVAFERGNIGVFQLLLADPARPWTHGRRRWLAADDR